MRTAIITGASSGLGRTFSRLLAVNPAYFSESLAIEAFWLLGRNEAALDALISELSVNSSVKFQSLICDLEKPEDVEMFCHKIELDGPEIVVFINNAGGGKFGNFDAVPAREQMTMLDVNVKSLVRITHAALAKMSEGARLIQIASSAGFAPLPGMAVYSATKAFVINFSRSLRSEVKGRGIVVTTVCPGAIQTDFFRKANEYDKVESLSKKYMMSTPEQVAGKALKDAKKKKILSVYSLPIKLSLIFCKLLPHRFISWFWRKSA